MHDRNTAWPRVAALLILTIGIALLWGVLVAWTIAVVAQLWQTDGRVYESLQVAMDGRPVIVTRSLGNYSDVSYRTLDGQPLPNQRELWLAGASLPAPIKPPALWESPINWPARIAGLSDSQRPPAAWYVVRNELPVGRAYLVGYDEFSKRRIGYIGRAGFRPGLPPEDEWFDIGRRRLDWGSAALIASGSIQYGGRPVTQAFLASEQRLPPWHVFLIDGDRLIQVDLRNRTLRSVHESPGLVSVSGLVEPRPAQADAVDETDPAAELILAYNPDTRIALRTTDQIIILDPPTGAKHSYPLPEMLRNTAVQVYSVGNEQLLVTWFSFDSRAETGLAWLAPDGSITRQEKFNPAGYQVSSPGEASLSVLLSSMAAPIPIGWLGGIFVGGPLSSLQTNQAVSYSAAVARSLEFGWLGLIAVLLMGTALAWWTYRRQRKYYRTNSGVWCGLVFAFGWPAFLAYWIEHRRPKMANCGECGTVVPRDRDTCAACNSLFPAPPLVGTEIYA